MAASKLSFKILVACLLAFIALAFGHINRASAQAYVGSGQVVTSASSSSGAVTTQAQQTVSANATATTSIWGSGGLPSQIKIWGITINLPRTGSFGFGPFQIGFGGARDAYVDQQICKIFTFTGGKFAALVMVVSGLVSIIAASMGMYKMALGTLCVGIGSAILPDFVEMFYGPVCKTFQFYVG